MVAPRERTKSLMVVATLCLFACERKAAARGNDSVELPPSLAATEGDTVVVPSSWRASDGPFLVVATEDVHVVSLVVPEGAASGTDSAPTVPGPIARLFRGAVDLLGRGGLIARATLQPREVAQRRECAWPRFSIEVRDSRGDDVHWGVGFAAAVAVPVALDSLERLSHADSVRLVADLARIASAMPDDSVAVFRGIPFSVRGAWMFAPARGAIAVIAEISRRVAQEANQREERLLLLAERDSAAGSRWQARWWARVNGSEETVEATDALAVVRMARDPWPTLVVGHDVPMEPWLEFVARDSVGAWRRRWRSGAGSGCP